MIDMEDALLERAVSLFQSGASIRGAAEELRVSKSKAERLKSKAKLLEFPLVPPSH
jgi:hypothetical protein